MLAYMKTFKCPKCPANFKFPGMDKTESSMEENSDFEDRDPGRLNQHMQHIWCIVPCLRAWRISCMAVRHFCTAATQALVRPCTEALGYVFHQVRVMNQKLPDTYEINRDDVHII
ncbi:unnamed protein product [Trichogramma brassicae]|uniref:Caveolin n=1 Tax=Trichogramma brassicae TaxID=86971 RepID=A0A6H5I894_9HYME|nr:unnamed protein product [Trichogramma brassicae]